MMRDPASECSFCGSEERWLLHNVRHRQSFRRVCTSCVLKLHPGSFCPHCFEVYEGSVPPLHERVMCLKCSSVSHLACVGLENTRQYVCPSCLNPSFLFFDVGSSNKKSKVSNGESVPSGSKGVIDQKLAKVFLSAARIAASSMAKAAAAYRVDAERRVKEAALTRKRAKEALERVAFLMAKEEEKEKEERKGKGLIVHPAYAMNMEQYKAKGNSVVAAAAAAQKPIQKNPRTEGKDKSGGIPTLTNIASTDRDGWVGVAAAAAQKPIQKIPRPEGKDKSGGIPTLTNIASTDKDGWVGVLPPNMVQGHQKGVSVDLKDKLKGPSAHVVAHQQVQNPLAVSPNQNSSNLLNSHNHVVVKEESNGVLPASPVAGQLQHANNHVKEEHRGKSGRLLDSDKGSQLPQSNQDPLALTTNSGVLLARSSNTVS
ncbi:uncharacterized protein LOC122056946 [Macadamia integrifolia]|uniref:uncharacterized protein LOC122056946 n=1 Tax=Macadamia integrifolia TaxID=60698 RepID=UPI001C52BCA4|nr:uncharacterized protein LOC122056946 [Macadamia integrifolia]XP_042474846.1 uncharacterized protein LOC122056946 [Macadamia integrifolia]XP_042474847.1 uncharacterized protein LOC122056946 [Macadamia integrifolia]XP_042474848.1 uncharacterized protein LOC122056946 [Macadamia integrifolia]XP_042474849.1 uncharacterized protein LOC122056946 [Macadamia integrifolia]